MLKFGEKLEKHWCVKRAQEYLANKKVERCWPFIIDFDGIEYVEYFALSPEDEAIVRNTIQECVDDSQMTKEQLAKKRNWLIH